MPPAQQMDVQVIDSLPSIRAGIDHQTVALLQTFLTSHLTGQMQQMP